MKRGDKFVCSKCLRQQSYAPADIPGGITESEAVTIGWSYVLQNNEQVWTCPFCNGNTEPLEKIFQRKRRGFWEGVFSSVRKVILN